MEDFDGEAFVAFADLCGFTEMVKARGSRAAKALDLLYNTSYRLLQAAQDLDAIAVSDCVVAWGRANDGGLDALLRLLGNLHVQMLDGGYLMRTTVSRGQFCYQSRIELPNLAKGMVHGNAYLEAYLNNKKAEAGSITFVLQDTEPNFEQWAPGHCRRIKPADRGGRRNHSQWEFFWATDEHGIEELSKARKDSYDARFAHLREVYRSHKERRESVRPPRSSPRSS